MVEVRLGRDMAATAAGSSKKSASHNAARQVCQILRGVD
jgi:dsRNA-specific ribonuclease